METFEVEEALRQELLPQRDENLISNGGLLGAEKRRRTLALAMLVLVVLVIFTFSTGGSTVVLEEAPAHIETSATSSESGSRPPPEFHAVSVASAKPTTTSRPEPSATSSNFETTLPKIQDFLLDHHIADHSQLENKDSPQFKACEFLAKQVENIDFTDEYALTTRYVLAVLYYATGGPTWKYHMNFLEKFSPCFWYQVLQYPDMSQEFRGVACTEEQEIAALFVTNNTLSGSIPTELALLTTLRAIDMKFNSLSGTIPESISGLTNLQNFFVLSNELTGSIPSFPNGAIKNINLAGNRFSGPVSHWSGANMTHIAGLALDQNQLTGNINVFNSQNFPELEELYLSDNEFSGTLTGEGIATLDKLTHVDLSHNQFTGSVPSHLFNMPNLTALDLNNNPLTGKLPSFHQNSSLELLALQNCSFAQQKIPPTLSNLRSLQFLDLSWNAFTGSIPTSLEHLTNLENLFLAQNPLAETKLEQWLPKLTSLKEVSLKNTQAKGPIPDLTNLTDLVLLDLDQNQLTSSIPASLGELTKLRFLLLNRNALTGEIPGIVLALSSLDLFFFEGNKEPLTSDPTSNCESPLAQKEDAIMIGECDTCSCCTICCGQFGEETGCNENQRVPDYDPVWESSFKSSQFRFGPKAIFKNPDYH